ncbi:MAG: DUF3467 domain-containing protein [bacterium]
MEGKKKETVMKAEKMEAVLDPDAKIGKYSNFVQIQHTPLDFRMDFAQVVPEDKKYYVNSRIFMSPQHAKLFANAMVDNIQKYERQFGEIKVGTVRFSPASDEIH